MKKTIASVLSSICFSLLCFSQPHHDLLDPKVRDLLHEALSGELAKEHVIQITRYHRIQGSRGYRDAAHYVLGKLREYGFSEKDAYIESFKSDGKATYQTWQSPSGWDITAAELRMVEPYDERIVGYPEIAMSVITYSNAGDATGELVWVGRGESDDDYIGKDVKGKFVLATGYGGNVHRLAVLKYGAKAVVCYLDDDRAKFYPDMLQYTGMWPRTEELGRVTFGFNLTNRQGEKLKSLLLSGKKVVLHGWVKGIGLEPYFMDIVVAHIRGTDNADEELVFSAHLDHPKESANDNASGSGAILDIARTLKQLIDDGRLMKPKRTFTFLWVPEWNGTMAYLDAHPELKGPGLGGKFLANLNMDMVGENLELLHSRLYIMRTPASIPSCINDVVENMAEMVDNMSITTPRGSHSEMNYRITPYGGGSDHMMFIDRKIPGMMFGHGDYTHHSSEDTPDKVDPVELERCEIISTGAMWYLANLSDREAIDLAYVVHRRASDELSQAARTAQQGTKNNVEEPFVILSEARERSVAALESIKFFMSSDEVATRIDALARQIRQQHEDLLKTITTPDGRPLVNVKFKPGKTDTRIPMRLTRGPLDFGLPESKLDSTGAAWYHSKGFTLNGDERFELVNFIDGKRTVAAIRDALSAEFQPIEPVVIAHYIEDLVKVGVVKWK
jgi:hypothetical protein